MLDVVDAVGQRTLVERHHAAGHVVGRQTGEGENHADDGDVDIREDVRWRPKGGSGPEDEDQQGHNDEGIRSSQRKPNDSNHSALLCETMLRSPWPPIVRADVTSLPHSENVVSSSAPA